MTLPILCHSTPSRIKGSLHWLEGHYLLHAVCVCSIMKLFALLPLLVLTLLQGTLATHLETCQCDQVRQLVNSTVQEAVTGLEDRLSLLIHSAVNNINTTDNSALENLENRLTDTMERLLTPIQQQLDYHLPPKPNSPDHPATSCRDAFEKYRNAPSGYYWISNKSGSASPVRVYCSMSLTCGNQTGGWMRVANIDMRNNSHTCPSGLRLISFSKRLCDGTSDGCVSNSFSVQDVQYSHVCGKIIGYQRRVSIAFHYSNRWHDIDSRYVNGVSLTHGQSPRKHIWTFAGAADETVNNYSFKCPCINPALDPRVSSRIPSFVGNDYFCDTALSVHYPSVPNTLQPSDPLWDGKGCGPASTCCSFNTPPWFVKDLPSPTTDDLEMRVCRPDGSESTPVEIVELYVQ